MAYIERAALVGVGVWIGIAVSRTEFEAAALPIYAVAAVLLWVGRRAVVRYRDRRDMLGNG